MDRGRDGMARKRVKEMHIFSSASDRKASGTEVQDLHQHESKYELRSIHTFQLANCPKAPKKPRLDFKARKNHEKNARGLISSEKQMGCMAPGPEPSKFERKITQMR